MSICLVQMPYAALERPSIALGLLKSSLQKKTLEAKVYYPNWKWAERIGLVHYQALSESPAASLLGEWSFAGAAFGTDLSMEFLDEVLEREVPGWSQAALRKAALAARQQACAFLDEVVSEILQTDPKMVGCSSTFQQNCASLGLLKRIKHLSPNIVTMMGGANCDGEMGHQLVRSFPWLDFIFSGEADLSFAAFCEGLLGKTEANNSSYPVGIVHASLGACTNSRATLADMDQAPIPEYDDYFHTRLSSKLKRWVYPGLTIETSRGCWWGQKHHCTFCGLNGGGMKYRSKSPERVLNEFQELAETYNTRQFEVVDNILDMKHVRTVLPRLEPHQYKIFYETKANLKRSQLETLQKAGVLWIQPGIESLHDEILELMDKGNSAAMNVELLRNCKELGIRVDWSILCGFPGEEDDHYREMAAWVKTISHLEPPIGVFRIRYDRFSPYHSNPGKYGVKLKPYWTYQHCYPLEPEALGNLAYFFEDDGTGPPGRYLPEEEKETRPGLVALKQEVSKWQKDYDGTRNLIIEEMDDTLWVTDTRSDAQRKVYQLRGLECRLVRACDVPTPEDKLRQKVGDVADHHWTETLTKLQDLGLLLSLSGRLVCLGLRARPHPPLSHFPGGSVMLPGAWA